ncbi:ribonuclease H-like domain-containing protein [Kockiozyma suomiensis]|uniref:ribonuclease H-like domain-containing protein n=1 Tax=Kockiozyma suomiensis TaxID=1337062 RepID=UPI00334368E9
MQQVKTHLSQGCRQLHNRKVYDQARVMATEHKKHMTRLAAVQTRASVIPLDDERRTSATRYFRAHLFFTGGWDIHVGVYRGKKDLFLRDDQIEYFFDKVRRRTGVDVGYIVDEEQILPEQIEGLVNLAQVFSVSSFEEIVKKTDGVSYDLDPLLLEAEEPVLTGKPLKAAQRSALVDASREVMVENIKTFIKEQSKVFVAIDIEAYERNQGKITEIGIAIWDSSLPSTTAPDVRHFRVQESLHLRNGKYVPDASEKFDFGKSEILTLAACTAIVQQLFDGLHDKSVFVGHDAKQDINFLKSIGVYLPNYIPVADTLELWRMRFGNQAPARMRVVLNGLGISSQNLHNAGNDAYYTIQALKKMFIGNAWW